MDFNIKKWVRTQKNAVLGVLIAAASLLLPNMSEHTVNIPGFLLYGNVIRVLIMIYLALTTISTLEILGNNISKQAKILIAAPGLWHVLNIIGIIRVPYRSLKYGSFIHLLGYIILVLALIEDFNNYEEITREYVE